MQVTGAARIRGTIPSARRQDGFFAIDRAGDPRHGVALRHRERPEHRGGGSETPSGGRRRARSPAGKGGADRARRARPQPARKPAVPGPGQRRDRGPARRQQLPVVYRPTAVENAGAAGSAGRRRRTALVRALGGFHRLRRFRDQLGYPRHLDGPRDGACRRRRRDRVRARSGRGHADAGRPRGRQRRFGLHLDRPRQLQGRELSGRGEREHRHDLRAEPALRARRLSRRRAVQRPADGHHARRPVRDRGAGRGEADREGDRAAAHQRCGRRRLFREMGHRALPLHRRQAAGLLSLRRPL